MTSGEALTRRLTDAERNRDHAPVPVRDAASLIVLDRANHTVLMGRRSARHAFFPGRHVFPGGRVDPGDARVRAAISYAPTTMTKLTAALPARYGEARARAFGVAALRETFEETGVLIGRPDAAPKDLPGGAIWAPFRERSIALDLSRLTFIARAVTPPGRPRRYDTRFFLVGADDIAHIDAERVGEDAELEEIAWIPVEKARGMELPTITLTVLDEMMAALDGPAERRVPYYRWQRSGFIRDLL